MKSDEFKEAEVWVVVKVGYRRSRKKKGKVVAVKKGKEIIVEVKEGKRNSWSCQGGIN